MGGFLSEIVEEGDYLKRAQRPKAKTIEPEILLIHCSRNGKSNCGSLDE